MKKLTILPLLLLGVAACGDDGDAPPDNQITCGANTMLQGTECVAVDDEDITCGPGTMEMMGMCIPTEEETTFRQVEHLARPGIAEALLLSDAFLEGYNATAPTFEGVPPDVLAMVAGEAKVVLRAIYLGTCLINGAVGLTPETGFKPAGIMCHAVGTAIFEADGETQTAASVTASQAYADAVFGLFIPDVMRIDTAVTSAYLTPCGGGPMLLCGGRWLRDDVIDVTYDLLLNGGATCGGVDCSATPQPFRALVSDGVVYDPDQDNAPRGGNGSRLAGNPNNTQQGHPALSNNFPYSAPPI